ncbi:protein EVI2A [Heliangelus exortis]|uniref:protein EVI2A n=1 Tax=Heliangelus exortis TaxID=472823 RepID=UPI003A94A1FB
MATQRHSKLCFTFPVVIIFSLCLQTSTNHTAYPGVINDTWNPLSQNLSGSQNVTEANTNSAFEVEMSTLLPLPSTMAQNPTSSPARSAVPATGAPRNTSKPRGTMTKAACEDNKSLIMICFIIIAVLVLICTFLFLATVVIANKMSYLKKTQQGKRRPRSNGDILASNSLWPTAAGTWQRIPTETSGTDLVMQDLIPGRDAAIQRKTKDEATEKLTKETDIAQEKKEPSKSHQPILSHFVVEI